MKAFRILRAISVVAAIVLLCYLVVVTIRFKRPTQDETCTSLAVSIKSHNERTFVTEADITASLKQAGLHPAGRLMSALNTDKIEKEILRNGMIAEAEAYKTPAGIIRLDLTEKTPVMRVMSNAGDYYIDSKGGTMPAGPRYAAYLPVASGYIEKNVAASNLYKFALFLQGNDFWNNQIEQIYIYPNQEVELIPRVGGHRIMLGTFDDFKEKLENLRLFYEQAVTKFGWNKYSKINLKYKNQGGCTKK